MLKIVDIWKNFGGVNVLQHVSMEINRGETLAIIGPSGCGKTTLLRCIALFEEISIGSIHINGRPVVSVGGDGRRIVHVDVDSYRATTGLVFQNLNIWPHRRVIDNLTLAPCVVRRMTLQDAKNQALILLESMGIIDKAGLYPHALSGGQLQRVAIARALMMEPNLLLLDEITSALDPESSEEIMKIIARLSRDGLTVVMVSHELSLVSRVAHRVAFMDKGELVEIGTTDQMFNSPNTGRQRSFLNNWRVSGQGEVRRNV